MLSLLLDQQMSPDVADQVRRKRPDARIESIYHWREGAFVGAPDSVVLKAAAQSALTLVTYDRSTITPLLVEWGLEGRSHGGVIFIDEETITQADIGGQVRGLVALWDREHAADWTDRPAFIRPARQ